MGSAALLLGASKKRTVNSFRGSGYFSWAGCAFDVTYCQALVYSLVWPGGIWRRLWADHAGTSSGHACSQPLYSHLLERCAGVLHEQTLFHSSVALEAVMLRALHTVNPQHGTNALLIFTNRELFVLASRDTSFPLWILSEAIHGLARTLLLSGY